MFLIIFIFLLVKSKSGLLYLYSLFIHGNTKFRVMNMKKSVNKLLLVITILIPLLFCGCPDEEQQQQQQPSKTQSEQEDKDSTKLKKIQDDIEAIIEKLSGIPQQELKKQEEEEQKAVQEGGGGEEGQSNQGQQGNQNSQNGQQGGQEMQGGQQQGGEASQGMDQQQGAQQKSLIQKQKPVEWETVFKDTQKLHVEWNEYIAQAAKDGVPKNSIDSFGNTLIQFTNFIIMKKKEEAVINANNLLFSLINFWSHYDSKIPPDVMKLKYFIRNVIFYSAVNKWDKVNENINAGKTLFQTLRATADKEQQEKINKIDFSIQEIEKVIKMHDYPLIRLKGKIVTDNLKELEKKDEE